MVGTKTLRRTPPWQGRPPLMLFTSLSSVLVVEVVAGLRRDLVSYFFLAAFLAAFFTTFFAAFFAAFAIVMSPPFGVS